MKIGVLFAGQGAQYSGMGKSLYDNSQEARAVFEMAGNDIKNLCFSGTKEELKETQNTQPTVFTVEMAGFEALKEELNKLDKKIEIAGMAGFSLGEYGALKASGVISDFNTALELVKKRGRFMSEAGTDSEGTLKGGMAAVIGEREGILALVGETKAGDILEAVNFNSPMQTVVAGDLVAIDRLRKRAKEIGTSKVIPLSVSTAFHSTMMKPAGEKLEKELETIAIKSPTTILYSNITGKDIMAPRPEEIDEERWLKSQMVIQLMHPVYWQETIENMILAGIEIFIEVGPGKTLSGLVRKINGDVLAMNVEDKESLDETVSKLRELMK